MKVIGILSLLAGAALLALLLASWVSLIYQYGPAEALRIAFTLWPGNAIGGVVFVLMVVLMAGGLQLLTTKKNRS